MAFLFCEQLQFFWGMTYRIFHTYEGGVGGRRIWLGVSAITTRLVACRMQWFEMPQPAVNKLVGLIRNFKKRWPMSNCEHRHVL